VASHRRTPQGLAARTTRVTVLSAAAACAAMSGTAAQKAAADPGGGPPQDAATRLDRLYQQAETATQEYDAAQERTRRLRTDLSALQDRAARGQQQVNELRDEVGLLAASQYRDGGIDPSLALLLSDDPTEYLARAATLDRLGGKQTERLRQLRDAQRGVAQRRAQAVGTLDDLRHAGTVLADRKRAVQRSLADAQHLLDAMPAAQRARYTHVLSERASREQVQPGLPDLTALTALPAESGRAALAVATVRQMVGAPYVWGATGPNSFDCSGLMLYAYQRAGVALPRTSQEQMRAGRQVPLDRIRPGDLVVYRANASHVAMYVGGGQVVHAPYPGARVRYDPVGMMPITAVTRP
jgi:cell wall-associated NlpC family hydrolase